MSSDEEGVEDIDFDLEDEGDDSNELDEDTAAVLDDMTEEGDEDSADDDSDDMSDDDDEEEEEEEEESIMLHRPPPAPTLHPATMPLPPPSGGLPMDVDVSTVPEIEQQDSRTPSRKVTTPPPEPPSHKRSPSPAELRKRSLMSPIGAGRYLGHSYTVEAICALPHPVPTHSLASSFCMTHLLTGSDDGYIRDYDIFSAVNGKNFLTAPQRHHSGVVEGIMKAGQIRCWWENPGVVYTSGLDPAKMLQDDDLTLSPVYSMAMHSDALWMLAGTEVGHINLFTVRHDPGRLIHSMNGHRGPVSVLSMDYDEKGFFSAGWDSEAIVSARAHLIAVSAYSNRHQQWDLNTGQIVRKFIAHNSQLAALAVRPQYPDWIDPAPAVVPQSTDTTDSPSSAENAEPDLAPSPQPTPAPPAPSAPSASSPPATGQNASDADTKSEASFDPLFDEEAEDEEFSIPPASQAVASKRAIPSNAPPPPRPPPAPPREVVPPPKGAPLLLDPVTYSTFSPDLLMTASIDGQIIFWDRRVNASGTGVGRLWLNEKTPPWCLSACWSADGGQIYAGRRNGTIDVWDVRLLGRSGPTSTPRLLKTLRNPLSSGVVSCVVSFPDCRHIACASNDNIRLWNVAEAADVDTSMKAKGGVQFKIIPGHHGGHISQMLVDPGARFLVSASSNRGWHGDSTRTVFVHDIKSSFKTT
ncbi:hypothetical protein AX16_004762 [Volvariella volvacea WC 439]|nr:hypothetical protein AX16_004762 [Volvariella volvacea WC 439]